MKTERYRSLNSYFRERFSKKIYKLSLSLAKTCPNRDGTAGKGGCIFCSRDGSGDFAADATLSVSKQIEQAKTRVAAKAQNAEFCAYFQSFTSTYCEYEKMKSAFFEAIGRDDIAALSIATRPDCIPDKTLELLCELNRIKPVFVELGLQTSSDETAKRINRCYPTSVYDDAVKRLKSAGINTVTHMIIGLPGETKEDMLNTARHIANAGSNGVKLQLLHVLKNTELNEMYQKGEFEVLTIEKYAEILADCIRILPPDTVIHRITGDGAKRELVAPLWSGNKKAVLNYINKYFDEHNVIQGEKAV